MELIQFLKPSSSRRNLLFIAAFVWLIAGGMLLFRGILMMDIDHHLLLFRILLGLVFGMLFYRVLFSKISRKHIVRINHLKNDRPCMFSFFNARSYVMMTMMISMGVYLRKSGLVPPIYLSVFYVTMGIPLFVSAFRFYYSAIHFDKSVVRKNQ